MRLHNKIAIITGAASGIGRACAVRYAQEGAKVVAADINETGLQQTVDMVKDAGGEAAFIRTDVGSPDDMQRMFDFTVQTYGGLDIYHNNAYWTEARTAIETTLENWHKTLDVTLRPAWLGGKLSVPLMKARGGGVILFTASVHSLIGVAGYAAYQAAKGGMMSLVRTMALELAKDNIRVVAVLPGAIDTPAVRISRDMDVSDFIREVPMGRLGLPEEIASAAAFLVSDDASYITGTGLLVDGGYTAK
jgi:NAD(P)-dependent dehydrogenase (short-subunit alcohol dehydrogenase family)